MTTTARPVCTNCGAQNCYTTKDGTIVCRTCGHREPTPAHARRGQRAHRRRGMNQHDPLRAMLIDDATPEEIAAYDKVCEILEPMSPKQRAQEISFLQFLYIHGDTDRVRREWYEIEAQFPEDDSHPDPPAEGMK